MEQNRVGRARRFEIIGLCLGAAWLGLSAFAVLTPWLSGPLFVPLGMLLGVFAVYLCGLFLWAGGRDEAASFDQNPIFAPLD